MSLIERMRKQKAVYWEKTGIDRYGNNIYQDAIEIDCRWEESNNEAVSAEVFKINITDKIYVDRDMKPGDVMKLCLLTDLTADEISSQDPERITGANSVKTWSKNFNVRRTKILRIVTL